MPSRMTARLPYKLLGENHTGRLRAAGPVRWSSKVKTAAPRKVPRADVKYSSSIFLSSLIAGVIICECVLFVSFPATVFKIYNIAKKFECPFVESSS